MEQPNSVEGRIVMRKLLILSFCLVVSGIASAQEVTLRLGHFLPPQATAPADFLRPWAEKVMKESRGRIEIEFFPSSQLAAPPAIYDAVKDGIMDLGWTLLGYTPGRFPISEVFELPFIAGNAEATSQAAWEFYENHLTQEFRDVKMIAFHVHGPGLFHIKGKPVKNLSDLAGRTIRAPTRSMNQALELIGAEPVGMPVPQVPEAISRGVIEGTVLPYEVTTSLKLAELVDSHTDFEGNRAMYTAAIIFAMNRRSYNRLPADLKAIIDRNSGLVASRWVGRIMDEGDAPGLAAAKAQKNDFYFFSEEEREEWIAATQPVVDDWVTRMDRGGLDGNALLREARNLIAKHEKQ